MLHPSYVAVTIYGVIYCKASDTIGIFTGRAGATHG